MRKHDGNVERGDCDVEFFEYKFVVEETVLNKITDIMQKCGISVEDDRYF